MSPQNRRTDWIDDDEYPDERDEDEFGEDSRLDYDRRSIGRVKGVNDKPLWTPGRIVIAVILIILLLALLLPEILPLLRR